jgi:hypothetical protein
MRIDYTTYTKLVAEVMQTVASEKSREARLPGPYDDAESELHDERVLIAAREYVAAHEGEEVIGG